MIYPSISELTKKTDGRYSLVIATAKRARQISEDGEKDVIKPVIEAIKEIDNDTVKIINQA